MPLLHGLSIRSHGQGVGYSHQALPQIQHFLQEVTPRVEQNRTVERRVISAFNSANYAELEQCYHDNWTCDGQANRQGAEGVRQLVGQMFSVFADLETGIEEIAADAEKKMKRYA